MTELEKKVTQEKAKEKLLTEKMQEFQENVQSLDEEVKRCRDLRDNMHIVIDPLKVCFSLILLKFNNITTLISIL